MDAIQKITKLDKDELIVLLDSFELPILDLDNKAISFYSFKENGVLVGCGAIERTGASPLVRSLAVRKAFQKKGIGNQLLQFIENILAREGHSRAYLLTEIPSYFRSRGYIDVERNTAPEEIQRTQEFSKLCPDSAQLMMKQL